MASRPIQTLPLPHFLKKALSDAGYKTTDNVLPISPADLAAELGIGVAQAEDLIRQCHSAEAESSSASKKRLSNGEASGHLPSSTAAELLSDQSLPRFSTFVTAIDDLIQSCTSRSERNGDENGNGHSEALSSGAVVPGMVLEMSGPPGIGKTCMALGLTLSARLASYKGKESASRSEVLYIDTEGGMTPHRIHRAVETLTRTSSTDPIRVISGIHLVHVATQIQMVAFLHTLDDWLGEHKEVKLVIIDTLSYHFRQPTLDPNVRRRGMDLVKQQIAKATTVHHCAVVVLNQLATKLFTADNKQGNFETGEKAVLMPHLGESWTTAKTIKLALFRGPPGDDLRYAHVSTSADGSFDSRWASFDIDAEGMPTDV